MCRGWVFLISPFVGRILDWYKKSEGVDGYPADEDPGVVSVSEIYNYYKQHDYNTVVMGASFRSTDEILALAGCDRLTIGPDLLESLNKTTGDVPIKLAFNGDVKARPKRLSEADFRWSHNQDPMAVEKLAEGIRNFALDQNKLEVTLRAQL